MANILFSIPQWPGSDRRLFRRTHVVKNDKGECFVVDTCNLIVNRKDEGYFETTVTPYDSKVADDILSYKRPHRFEDPIADQYAHMWSGCGKYSITYLRHKKKYDSPQQAMTYHLERIHNL